MKKIFVIILIILLLFLAIFFINKSLNNKNLDKLQTDESLSKTNIVNEQIENTNNENNVINNISNQNTNNSGNNEYRIDGLFVIVDSNNLETTTYYFSENNTVTFEATSYYLEGTYKIDDNKIQINYDKSYYTEGEETNFFPNGRKEELTIISNDEITIPVVINGKKVTQTYRKSEQN